MVLFVWNIRGVNGSRMRRKVLTLLNKKKRLRPWGVGKKNEVEKL